MPRRRTQLRGRACSSRVVELHSPPCLFREGATRRRWGCDRGAWQSPTTRHACQAGARAPAEPHGSVPTAAHAHTRAGVLGGRLLAPAGVVQPRRAGGAGAAGPGGAGRRRAPQVRAGPAARPGRAVGGPRRRRPWRAAGAGGRARRRRRLRCGCGPAWPGRPRVVLLLSHLSAQACTPVAGGGPACFSSHRRAHVAPCNILLVCVRHICLM